MEHAGDAHALDPLGPQAELEGGLLGVAADRLRVPGGARVADVERLRQADDGRELQLGPAGVRRRGEHARHLGAVDDRAVLAELLGRAHRAGGGGQQLLTIVAVVRQLATPKEIVTGAAWSAHER